jgi:hypothetical protein
MVFVAVIFLLDDSLFLTLSAEWILSDVYSLLDKIDQIHSSEHFNERESLGNGNQRISIHSTVL